MNDNATRKSMKLWAIIGCGGAVIVAALAFWVAIAHTGVTQEEQKDAFCELAGIIYANTQNAQRRALATAADTPAEVQIINASFGRSLDRLEQLPCDYGGVLKP